MILASSATARKFCGFCRNSDGNEVVSLNRIEPKVRKILGIELNDEDENATVCTVCVITLNQMEEKRQNMRNTFYKKKADSSYIKGDSGMAKMYLNQAAKDPLSKEVTSLIVNSNGNGLKIAEVRSQVEFNNSCDENGLDDHSDLTTDADSMLEKENSSNCLLLKPMKEDNVGRIIEDSKHKPSVILTCNECFKNFKTEHHFNRHRKMHRRRKSAIESNKNRKFMCPDCFIMFNKVALLKAHSLIHKPALNCTNCEKVFHAKLELDWHMVECDAKQEAVSTIADTLNKRRTRSETRSIRRLKERASECTADDGASSLVSSYVDSSYTGRHKLVEKFINERSQLPQEPPQLDQIVNYDSDDCDHRSVISNFTSVSQRSARKRRLYCTIHPFSELIVPLVYVNEFQCHDCRETYPHVSDIMKHEIKNHNVIPMFTCHECYTKFTRKNYLEMHELAHRPYFTCHQCQHVLPTRRALQSHLNLHLQKSYECIKCSRSFLTVPELKNHMDNDRHENNLNNLKIKKFIKSINKHYNNRRKSPRIKYKACDLIQPLGNNRKVKTKMYKIFKPIKTKLYDGFYEKIANVQPEEMFVRKTVDIVIEHHPIDETVEQYQADEANGDLLDEWNFDDNFDFQLFSVESLQGPPSNESLNEDFFEKLDTMYSNPKRLLSYTEIMEEF